MYLNKVISIRSPNCLLQYDAMKPTLRGKTSVARDTVL